jgi:glycerol uptake facilitator-like aquaporin
MFTKQKAAMLVAEFLGTGVLTFVILAVSMSNIGIGYFVALAAGLAVLIMALVFNAVSGALFNPALTLGLWTVRKLQTYQALLYIAVQMLGGLAAFWLFNYLSKTDVESQDLKYNAHVFVAEIVGTAVFSMGVAAALYQKVTTNAKASVLGGSYAVGILIASIASAAYLNPAVALSALGWGSGWGVWGSYVLGPILGAIVGFNLYNLIFLESGAVVLGLKAGSRAASVAKRPVATKKAPAKRKTTRRK